jgi:hypothetical protein
MTEGNKEKKHRGIEVFSAASDAPRVRWRTDLVSAAVTAALAVFLTSIHRFVDEVRMGASTKKAS